MRHQAAAVAARGGRCRSSTCQRQEAGTSAAASSCGVQADGSLVGAGVPVDAVAAVTAAAGLAGAQQSAGAVCGDPQRAERVGWAVGLPSQRRPDGVGCWSTWRRRCQATRRVARRPCRRCPTDSPIHWNRRVISRTRARCALAGSGDRSTAVRAGAQSAASAGGAWPSQRVAKRWSTGTSRAWARACQVLRDADGAALLDFDEGAPGQAAAAGEFVVGPAALAPQPRQLQTQRGEVRVGREDRHPTIRRCRPLPCQCRPLPYFCR